MICFYLLKLLNGFYDIGFVFVVYNLLLFVHDEHMYEICLKIINNNFSMVDTFCFDSVIVVVGLVKVTSMIIGFFVCNIRK